VTSVVERVPAAELGGLFLFESLSAEQLDWLAEHGRVERDAAETVVHREAEPATCFYVLLSGTIRMTRRVGGDDVEIIRSEQRGVYSGATQAYLEDRVEQTYAASLTAVTDTTFFVLPAAAFAGMMRDWFPMAMHLLEGLFFGMRNSQQIVGQRERLLALGSLTAGLTHELNNPAAAAVRATSTLRERVAGMRHKLAMLANGQLDPAQLQALTELQEAAVERAAKAPARSPLQVSDAEDALGEWLEDRGVVDPWSLAPVFVAAGLGVDWAEGVAGVADPSVCEGAFRWLAYTLETESLMSEIEDATTRISTLVGAAKQYSQLDRAPYQLIDLHDGLDSTLVMLARQLGRDIEVVKDYDRDLPRIPGYAAELNQVWTNLIDNALAAMGGRGRLTLRTRRQDSTAIVDVCDTGPGIEPENLRRVFEPFFTTKPVGEGTGLGLDISYRIVVSRHHGDLRVYSEPGDTRFEIRLPLHPASDAAATS
jgi:signal transduction histidine kinase